MLGDFDAIFDTKDEAQDLHTPKAPSNPRAATTVRAVAPTTAYSVSFIGLVKASYTKMVASFHTVPIMKGMSMLLRCWNSSMGCAVSNGDPAVGVHGRNNCSRFCKSAAMSFSTRTCAPTTSAVDASIKHADVLLAELHPAYCEHTTSGYSMRWDQLATTNLCQS